MGRVTGLIKVAFLGWAALLFAPTPAHAGRYTFEFGGGISMLNSASTFFESTDVPAMGSLFQFSGTFRVRPRFPILRLGILHRIHMATGVTASYGMQSTYPILQADLSRLYLNLGATPFVWRSSSGLSGYAGWGSFGVMGELGFKFPITEEISFNLATSAETVSVPGGMSPSPAIGGMASFRLNFGPKDSAASKGTSVYDGYRYPDGFNR